MNFLFDYFVELSLISNSNFYRVWWNENSWKSINFLLSFRLDFKAICLKNNYVLTDFWYFLTTKLTWSKKSINWVSTNWVLARTFETWIYFWMRSTRNLKVTLSSNSAVMLSFRKYYLIQLPTTTIKQKQQNKQRGARRRSH